MPMPDAEFKALLTKIENNTAGSVLDMPTKQIGDRGTELLQTDSLD